MKITVNEGDIKRWHPHFKLEDVPAVEPSELPQPPFVKKFSTAQDVLDEVQDKLNPRVCMLDCGYAFLLTFLKYVVMTLSHCRLHCGVHSNAFEHGERSAPTLFPGTLNSQLQGLETVLLDNRKESARALLVGLLCYMFKNGLQELVHTTSDFIQYHSSFVFVDCDFQSKK